MLRRTRSIALASLLGAIALVGSDAAKAGPIGEAMNMLPAVQVPVGGSSAGSQVVVAVPAEHAETANTITGPVSLCIGLEGDSFPPGAEVCPGSHGIHNLRVVGKSYASNNGVVLSVLPGEAETRSGGAKVPCTSEVNLRVQAYFARGGGGGELSVLWDQVAPDGTVVPTGIDGDGNPGDGIDPVITKPPEPVKEDTFIVDFCK